MNIFPFDLEKRKYVPSVLILVGPPASGKTTFIRKKVSKLFVTLSRDEIRGRWFGPHYIPNKKAEDAVTLEYNYTRNKYINAGMYIVVDKTNCNEDHLREEIKKFKESNYVIFMKFFDVSLITLIFREIKRRLTDRSKPSVPFKVIKDMKNRYDKINKSKYNEYLFHE